MEFETVKNIGAIAAPLTKVVLETFLVPKFNELRESWKRTNVVIDHAFENKFHEYLNESYEKNAVLNTLAFKKRTVLLEDVYVPLELMCSQSEKKIKIDSFSDEIFESSSKILITDTAGMGKSTLLKKLLVSCIEQNRGVPILIELRRLSGKKGIIEEILEQLNPINDSLDKQFILDLINRGDFVFLFDGFDEISLDQRGKVTTEIQNFISKARNNKFILTSRPEDSLASFGDFHKFQIRPLKPIEAYTLLSNYDNGGENSQLLISKIKERKINKNIKEYLTSPLLVSLLYTAFEHKQRIPFKKHIFYRQVFDALYESHDLSKGDSFEREKNSGLGIDEFHRVLRIFGYLCLKNKNKIEFTKDELHSIIQRSIDYCDDLDVKPADFIKDIIVTVPLFTIDGIYYKWSHKSLQEYFAAQFIYLDSKEKQHDMLLRLCFHVENEAFINVIDLYRSIDPVGFEQRVTFKLLNDYLNFLDKTYKSFEGADKIQRQQYEFGFDLMLMNIAFGDDELEDDSAIEEFFVKVGRELKKQKKERKISVAVGVVEKEQNISNIKIPEIRTPYQTLIDFYFSHNASFVKRKQSVQKKSTIELVLPHKKVIPVTDRKNALLNKNGNFSKTNELVKLFLERVKGNLFIDPVEAKNKLDEIIRSQKNTNSEDLYEF